jgi:septal ring factor EnvC (AmiA/AmiB activator)
MMDNLWWLITAGVGVLVAVSQLFVKQGDVTIRELAVEVGQKELALDLNKKTAERVSLVEAQNITFSTQLTAMTQEFSKVVQQYTVTQTELATVKAENTQLRDEVAKLRVELTAQRDENAELRAEIEELRARVTVTENRPPDQRATGTLAAVASDVAAPDAKRDAEAT